MSDVANISTREYYNQKIDLYSLFDFFVEVLYTPLESRVDDIKVVTDDKTLDHYIYDRSSFIASMRVIVAGTRDFNDY